MSVSPKLRIAVVALGFMALEAVGSPAGATTNTTNLTVTVAVTAACNISVTNINFGSLASTALLSAQTSTAAMGGLFSYTCSPGSNSPALTYSQGLYYSSSNRMFGTTNGGYLPYSLTIPVISAFTGVAQTAQITATIPAQASLPAIDSYSDTVVLTLSY